MQQGIREIANNPQINRILRDFSTKREGIVFKEIKEDQIEKLKREITEIQMSPTIEELEKQEENTNKKIGLVTELSQIICAKNQKEKIAQMEKIAKTLKFYQLDDFFNSCSKLID